MQFRFGCYRTSGSALPRALDVDCGLQHAAANQFCLHGVRVAAVGVALHLDAGGLHPDGSRGSLGDDLPRAAGQVGTVRIKALVQE